MRSRVHVHSAVKHNGAHEAQEKDEKRSEYRSAIIEPNTNPRDRRCLEGPRQRDSETGELNRYSQGQETESDAERQERWTSVDRVSSAMPIEPDTEREIQARDSNRQGSKIGVMASI